MDRGSGKLGLWHRGRILPRQIAARAPVGRLFLFLFAYWLAQIVNGSFAVYFEGPMGGIWFWTVYGVGMSALWLYRWRPCSRRRQELR